MEQPVLLLTRPRASAERFAGQLDATLISGVDVIISPLVEITPTKFAVELHRYSGVVFTSSHAPACMDEGQGRIAYCVGKRTAQTAELRGWTVALVAETAEELVDVLHDPPTPLLHIAGTHRRGEIAQRLTLRGIPTDVAVVYDQVTQPLTTTARKCLAGSGPVIAPLFSPRTAQIFASQVQNLANVTVIAMSEAVAATLDGVSIGALQVAVAPTGDEMRRHVENMIRMTTLP